MIDLIRGEAQDEDGKVRQLFLDVQKRGPKAFKNLVGALVDSDNKVAANILDSNVVIETPPSPMKADMNKLVSQDGLLYQEPISLSFMF